MIIAREKKKNNIAEYILYMYQIEDIIRAHHFDINQIKQKVIDQFDQPPDIFEEMSVWYADLIEKMKNEKIQQKGHLNFLNDIVTSLEALHQSLLNDPEELKYIEIYNWAKPNIEELKNKMEDNHNGDIDICLRGLYGFLLLKLQKKEITRETVQAISTFSSLMALLSKKYKENSDHV